MHIFIDESGNFLTAPAGQSQVSVLGALVVPNARIRELERRWNYLRPSLPQDGGEVKGRLLSDCQVAQVVKLLHDHEALFEADVFDALYGQEKDILARKILQEQRLMENIPEALSQRDRDLAFTLAEMVARMPSQLFIQFTLLTGLVERTLHHAVSYYVQRRPKELASFHWVLDAKDPTRITSGEQWWKETIMPFLQSRSLDNPFPIINEFDYSHFHRFKVQGAENDAQTQYGIDMNRVMMEDFRFSPSAEPGLELVDIVTNATRRAIRREIGKAGWLPIRSIMIHRPRQYIGMHHFFGDDGMYERPPYADVLVAFKSGGRNMVIPKQRWRQRL